MRTPSVVAVAVMLLAGCGGPAERAHPDTVAASPATPAISTTPQPSPQPSGPQSSSPRPASSKSTKPVGAATTAKPGKPATPPTSSAVAGISGELVLDAPPGCWWVPKAFLNGDGGISVQFTVRSSAVSRSTDIGVTVVGGSGERGQTTAHLPQGDAQQRVTVITNADEGSYEAHLTATLDPQHRIRQAKGYDDDVATIRAVIPFPRPSTTSALSCYMVR